jgi:hypothetical protein
MGFPLDRCGVNGLQPNASVDSASSTNPEILKITWKIFCPTHDILKGDQKIRGIQG